ncbi:hypothetical protein [Petrachloros mirabilis]
MIVAVAVFLIDLGRRWYRRRVAARLADKMLADVLKAKDAFRR